MNIRWFLVATIFLFWSCNQTIQPTLHWRFNLLGFLPHDEIRGVLLSDQPLKDLNLSLVDSTSGQIIEGTTLNYFTAPEWGSWHHYTFIFNPVQKSGYYQLRYNSKNQGTIRVGQNLYDEAKEIPLVFLRQQRCGYNPFIGAYCHQADGKAFYGHVPDSSLVDARGGWHDAGDQLKYLITASYVTATMLKTYDLFGSTFVDSVDALGKPGKNGLADLLDEAKWGLDWIEKLHPAPDALYHQVADDRDHVGWKWPTEDPSNFGWGPDTFRVVYGANGQPQGLGKYKSKATGVSNIAGRSAAAFALASRIWKSDLYDAQTALRYLKHAKELYELGRRLPGYQQGNSFGAPYRYNESTWEDDMEWAAAELYATTGEKRYLEESWRYGRNFGPEGILNRDTAEHYFQYPFMNYGHAALAEWADQSVGDSLAAFYRTNFEKIKLKAQKNPYHVGIPFIWCSNNVLSAMLNQVIAYERMTGDKSYHDLLVAGRDWLLGQNPWGTSMFTGIPADREYPLDVHTSIYALSKVMVPGGLVDGPVMTPIFNSLIGLKMTDPDEFTPFQNQVCVYHDDIGDYSTNEPTMCGSGTAMFWWGYFAQPSNQKQ